MDTRSLFELRSLVGQRVFFRTPGLSGILEDVRVDGFLLVALSAPGRTVFGRGYLHASSLMPVERFPVHCSVLTQYGRGRVLAVEVRPIVGVVYTVAMQECRLTGGALATAYLAAPSVRASPNSAAEIALLKCVAEAEDLRLQGNAAFKASNFDAAIAAYERANTRVMQQVNATESSDVNPAIGDILKDVLVKGHNNLAVSLMRKGDHDSMLAALGVAQQGLRLDPSNMVGKRDFLLLHKAKAHKGLGQLHEALECIKSMSEVAQREQQDVHKLKGEIKALKERALSEQKKFARAAFGGKGSAAKEGEEAEASAPSATAAAAAKAGAASPKRDLQREMERAKSGGGATPQPSPKKPFEALGRGGGTETVEEESEEEATAEATEGNALWYVGAAAVGAVALGAAAYLYLKRRK